ncbi:MAG: Hpt domain-containing protein [Bacillota bacterium]
MSELFDLYIEETREHLEILDESLINLENDPGNHELINRIFRAAHTIKGSSAAMGFIKMENLTHSMEDVLHDLREGKLIADKKIIELLFVCHDFLENSLEHILNTGKEEDIKIDSILSRLHEIVKEAHGSHQRTSAETGGNAAKEQLELDLHDWDAIYDLKNSGLETFFINIRITEECAFKTVRAWLIFQELGSIINIIKSLPLIPTEEEFQNGTFSFEGNEILIAAASQEKKELLLRTIADMMDVETCDVRNVETFELQKGKGLKLITEKDLTSQDAIVENIIESDDENIIQVSKIFMDDFLNEISGIIDKAEMNLLLLATEKDNCDIAHQMYRAFHTISGMAGFLELKVLYDISHNTEKLFEDWKSNEFQANNKSVDLVLESIKLIKKICLNNIDYSAEILDAANELILMLNGHGSADEHESKRIGEILVDQGKLSREAAEEVLRKQQEYPGMKFGQVAVKEKKAEMEDIIQSLRAQEETSKNKVSAAHSNDAGYIRIPTHKVDSMVDMLGELLIVYSSIEQAASDVIGSDGKLMNNLMRMAKLIKSLQNISMSLRMVAMKSNFQKLLRVGRDTAKELGKEVIIDMMGEDTEVDRSIADKLLDPLMHIVRNSISHGIEDSEIRLQNNKPAQGNVIINAYSKRGSVYIEITDDGKGLDINKIYNKAKEKRLIDPNITYSDDEIIKFIFMPGFSTADAVNNISGRGVGMNVVDTEISKMGGKIDIFNKPGYGCSFILKIPINLAVINGTLVDINNSRYILPTLYIKQFFKPREDQWICIQGKKEMIRLRDDIIPLIPIHDILGFEAEQVEDELIIIIVEIEQKLKALPVRAVLGRQEIVAKPLGVDFGNLSFASGASILGDGRVSVILDVEALFKMDTKQ